MNKYYLEYDFDKTRFSSEDLDVVDVLKKAGHKIGELFARQVNGDHLPGASFYPADATKQELEEASKKNFQILNPYTVVKRDSAGDLFAIPYHEEYKEELKIIATLLIEASKITKSDNFKAYLEETAGQLKEGDYKGLEKTWVRLTNDSFLHLMIGPFGSYADGLFSLKKAYNFNFTFTSSNSTFNPFNYVDIIRNILPPFGSKTRLSVPPEKIKVRVDDVIAIGGRNAGLPARATNYPEDIELLNEVGTKIVVYTNNIQKRDGEMLLPLFRDLLDKSVHETFKDDFLMTNAVRFVMAHEITEALFQYKGSWGRLKGVFNYVMELHSNIVGIKACGFQLIKGVLTQKDLEAILYIMLMRTFSDYFVRKSTPQVENYLIGYRVFFNYCVENGAILLQKDTILPNPSRMFICADQLANVVMHMFAEETETEVKSFLDKYSSEYMYEKFSAKLSLYKF